MNNMWIAIMVIGIVAVISYSRVLRAKYNAEHGIVTDRKGRPVQTVIQPSGPSSRELELQREVEELRDRVKVLERIATDEHKPQRLAAEIESLRDN